MNGEGCFPIFTGRCLNAFSILWKLFDVTRGFSLSTMCSYCPSRPHSLETC